MDPVAALDRIAFLLERDGAPTYRVRAFRGASAAVAAMPPEELRRRAERAGGLEEVKGLGPKTAAVVREALAGERPAYLTRLAEGAADAVPGRRAARGCGCGPRCAATAICTPTGPTAAARSRRWPAPRWSWATSGRRSPTTPPADRRRGLTAERLRAQLEVVAEVGGRLGGSFRLLTGIECDILADGALDQNAELLDRLDVVVASVHSKLRMDRDEMTRRMISAISNPLVDVLGHCTGRLVSGKLRPESEFDADLVFAACERFGVAVEINSRPDRLDPPRRLLRKAVEAGVLFSIDSDAHAPGQLDWQIHGCARAEECGVPLSGSSTPGTWRPCCAGPAPARCRRRPPRAEPVPGPRAARGGRAGPSCPVRLRPGDTAASAARSRAAWVPSSGTSSRRAWRNARMPDGVSSEPGGRARRAGRRRVTVFRLRPLLNGLSGAGW